MDDFIMKLSQLVGGNLWLAPLIALLAGLLTSLTPCSLSTIPLILGCVGGLNEHEPKKAFRLSLTFAFGSMLTFTALGFAASLLGNLLNGLGPWLHLALALLLTSAVVFIDPIAEVFSLATDFGFDEFVIAFALALSTIVIVEIVKCFQRMYYKNKR